MQRLLSILGVLVYLNSFSQGNLNWPESINLGYFDNSELVTQANASIAIQESNFSNFSVNFPGETNPQSIPSGSIIGVFYDINNSEAIEEWVCGGFNFWPENNESFTIAAFEDEFGGEVNGFQSGDEYVWFLRINNSEDPLDGWTDYIASSAILQSDDYFSTTFGPNLFHNLLSANFVLYSEWSNCMDISACNYNQAATISDLDSCFYPAKHSCAMPGAMQRAEAVTVVDAMMDVVLMVRVVYVVVQMVKARASLSASRFSLTLSSWELSNSKVISASSMG